VNDKSGSWAVVDAIPYVYVLATPAAGARVIRMTVSTYGACLSSCYPFTTRASLLWDRQQQPSRDDVINIRILCRPCGCTHNPEVGRLVRMGLCCPRCKGSGTSACTRPGPLTRWRPQVQHLFKTEALAPALRPWTGRRLADEMFYSSQLSARRPTSLAMHLPGRCCVAASVSSALVPARLSLLNRFSTANPTNLPGGGHQADAASLHPPLDTGAARC
jgi:hypothetical protein